MNLQELRLGNYIRHNVKDDNGNFCEPNEASMDEDDMLHFLGGVGIQQEEFISITENWLLKCGFTRDDEWTPYRLKINSILHLQGNAFNQVALANEKNIEVGSIRFEYVHQLQNFWFALTGEELSFK